MRLPIPMMSRMLTRCMICLLAFVASAAAQAPSPVPTVRASKSVLVNIDSTPSGATVYDEHYVPSSGAGYVGRTPLSVAVDGSYSHDFYFVLSGYATVKERVALGQTAMSVALQPANPATWISHNASNHPYVAALLGVSLCGAFATPVLILLKRRPQAAAAPRIADTSTTQVDDYAIEAALGEGAFSRVYRVRHKQHGDTYAMKVLKADFLDREAIQRFFREMEIGRDLRHPALVPVYAFGDWDGVPYIVMEFAEGVTLERRLEDGPLPLCQALQVGEQLSDVLQYAHEKGIVHRDLKPANVMLAKEGDARLLDFGVARCFDMQKLTVTGAVMGTPAYMSPDHSRSRVDARSDVYSLGVMLFEMVSGRRPYDADDALAMMMAHISRPVPNVVSFVPDVPPALDELLQKMMAKKPARRPQTMRDVGAALSEIRRVLDG